VIDLVGELDSKKTVVDFKPQDQAMQTTKRSSQTSSLPTSLRSRMPSGWRYAYSSRRKSPRSNGT
jgi:hypothetical protein